jgi:hypothetical protein
VNTEFGARNRERQPVSQPQLDDLATGLDVTGKRKTISASEWVNLWPKFAMNRAAAPDSAYDEVRIFEIIGTPLEQLSSDCTAWLKERKIAGAVPKKYVLHSDAQRQFGSGLTHAIFDAAYRIVFGHGRGRPKTRVKTRN